MGLMGGREVVDEGRRQISPGLEKGNSRKRVKKFSEVRVGGEADGDRRAREVGATEGGP